ncbi:recombinase family protein [Methylacidiphilum fumariolicum]|nr:recombinase family protein [Candidatus Methylacidiphilum fumarolicum]
MYIKVSSAGQEEDLENQREALARFCLAQGKTVVERLEDCKQRAKL